MAIDAAPVVLIEILVSPFVRVAKTGAVREPTWIVSTLSGKMQGIDSLFKRRRPRKKTKLFFMRYVQTHRALLSRVVSWRVVT